MDFKKFDIYDFIGVLVERYLVWIPAIVVAGIIAVLHFSIAFTQFEFGSMVEAYVLEAYKKVLEKNIGTHTTIAAVLIGIYVTVFSIFGSLKINSVLAILDEKDLQKLIGFLKSAMVAAFVFLSYTVVLPIIENEFWIAYWYELLFWIMFTTAIRFCTVMMVIYEEDFKKLKFSIEEEKKEKEKVKYILEKTRVFLERMEEEDAIKKTKVIEMMQKDKRQ